MLGFAGKTESVKALGQALGRQVLVFNCDEEFDTQVSCPLHGCDVRYKGALFKERKRLCLSASASAGKGLTSTLAVA